MLLLFSLLNAVGLEQVLQNLNFSVSVYTFLSVISLWVSLNKFVSSCVRAHCLNVLFPIVFGASYLLFVYFFTCFSSTQ